MSRPFADLAVAALLVSACGGASDTSDLGAPAAPMDAAAPAPTPGAGADAGPPGAGAVPSSSSTYFPPRTGTWETVAATTAGFDPTRLETLAAFVEASRSTTFIVLHDGRILLEKYWKGADATTLRDIASAQKSILSMLLGTAMGKGLFGLEDTVTSILGPGWSNASPEEEAPVTVRQIVSMTSGLDGSMKYAAPAGSTWLYNTDAYHRSDYLIEARTGQSLQAYTRAALFDPIGVGTSAWDKRAFQKDSKGVPVNALEMNARDMARVGLVIMNGGVWAGQEVVPTIYLGQATTPSQILNPSYGFLFWLNGQSSVVLPPSMPRAGMLIPSAPADVVSALGANDQKIHVSRKEKLVVIRQGQSAGEAAAAATGWDDELWKRVVAAKLTP